MTKIKNRRPVSKRQQMVIKLIMTGFSYADISGEMNIRYSTVVTHVNRIKIRYLVRTEAEIVAFALNDGFTFNPNTRHVYYHGKVIL